MALHANFCWTLVLCACLALTVRAECERDCALCVYRLMAEQTESNTASCTLECDGIVDAVKLELCRDTLTEEDHADIDTPQIGAAAHQLSKKYGGFMKRYGGFMIKKAAELGGAALAKGDGAEIVSKKYGGFMKKDGSEAVADEKQLALLRELLDAGFSPESGDQRTEDGVSKRYGGFMRSLRGSGSQEEAGKELYKRYGGFMRRVGRPEWLGDYKNYGGPVRRSWEEAERETSLPDTQKRYGGFMD